MLILLCGCSAGPVCSAELMQNKTILNESEQTFKCSCECPKSSNVVNAGGILGGLLNWFDDDGI